MRTIETKVYKFNELSEQAKQTAIEKLSNINTDYDWYESTIEDLTEDLNKLGFEGVEIGFSGFWSQGDGASFTADSIDIKKYINLINPNKYRRLIRLMDAQMIDISGCVKRDRNMHYMHENTTSVHFDVNMYGRLGTSAGNVESLIYELENEINEDLAPRNKDIYRILEKEYEYLASKEAIIETIEANEYEFTEDGKLI